MLLRVCAVIDQRRSQNVVGTSVTDSDASLATLSWLRIYLSITRFVSPNARGHSSLFQLLVAGKSSESGQLATFAPNLVAKTFAISIRTIAIQGADCPTDLYRGRLS